MSEEKNSRMLKRIKKELSEIDNYRIECKELENSIKVEIREDNLLELFLCNNYPFKAPKFYVNKTNYRNRYKYMYERYKYLLKKKEISCPLSCPLSCPCCDTVLCDWSPGNKLIQILQEYEEREKIYNRLRTILSIFIVRIQLQGQLLFDNLIVENIIDFI